MDMMQGSDDASLDGSAILPMAVNPSNRSTHTTGSRKSNEGFDSASRSSISNRAAVVRIHQAWFYTECCITVNLVFTVLSYNLNIIND